METLSIPSSEPTNAELKALRERAQNVLKLLRSEDSELRLPLFIEFAGSPKSGKSSIIGIVCHFFSRIGFYAVQPVEGASIRTPPSLRDDWLAFNAWSGCYALRHIIEDSHGESPPELVFLDRGLFDAAAWMQFLHSKYERLTDVEKDKITEFFMLDLWRNREVAVFLLTADPETSLERETDSKLIQTHGSVMNDDVLKGLVEAYEAVAQRLGSSFRKLIRLDTSAAK